MDELTLKQKYECFQNTVNSCGSFLLDLSNDDIEYRLFEEFDGDRISFMSEELLLSLLNGNSITDEIYQMSMTLAEMFGALEEKADEVGWTASAVRISSEWKDFLLLCDRLAKALAGNNRFIVRRLTESEYLKLKPKYPCVVEAEHQAPQYFLLEKDNATRILLSRDDIGLAAVHSITFEDYGCSLFTALNNCYSISHLDKTIRIATPLHSPCMGIELVNQRCYLICESELVEYGLNNKQWRVARDFSDMVKDYHISDDSLFLEFYDGNTMIISKVD